MKNLFVSKGLFQGKITVPPSKSHTLRAVLFGSLAKGKTVIHHPLLSPDTFSMVEACRSLGAKIAIFPDSIEIQGIDGKITGAEKEIDAGNSGLVLRMISAIAALAAKPIEITGDHSICHRRDMTPMIEALSPLGVQMISTKGDGCAPLLIKGPMEGKEIFVVGEDSQFVSSLLIASIFRNCPTTIYVKNPGEKPWVQLTLDWFRKLSIPYQQEGFIVYRMQGGHSYPGFTYTVPGDFSSAAFPIASAVIQGTELEVSNLQMQDAQGDKEFLFVLQRMGASLEIRENSVLVKKGSDLLGIDVDVNDFIDSIPILAVIGCFAKGTTRIANAAIARGKECDRIHCITEELKKMGANIIEQEDGVIVHHSSLHAAEVSSHQDHRMAMALAVAGGALEGKTTILGSACIRKTYPTFVEDFQKIGARIEEI